MTEKQDSLIQRVLGGPIIDTERRLVDPIVAVPMVGSLVGSLVGAIVPAALYQSTEPRDVILGAIGGALVYTGCAIASRMKNRYNNNDL